MANWHYYNKNGEKIGPISVAALKALTARGLITRDTVLVNHTGRTLLAGEVNGLTFPETTTNPPAKNVKKEISLCKSEVNQAVGNNPQKTTYSTLHAAAKANDPEAIVALVQAGADIHEIDVFGFSPLHTAAESDAVEAIHALLELGADIEMRADGGHLKESFSSGAFGNTPLNYAAKRNAVKAITALANAGADVNAKDDRGNTLLHAAITFKAAEAIAALVQAGANINLKNAYGYTPLHHAANENFPECIVALIKAGADIGAKNDSGLTPLQHAIFANKTEAIAALTQAENVRNPFAPVPATQPTNPNPFTQSAPPMIPQNTNSFERPAPPLSTNPLEAAFMQRCPEIDLSVIPRGGRPVFMNQYEEFRPQLEGDDILCFLTEQEFKYDPYLQQFEIEALQEVNSNGVWLLYCRIYDAGRDCYNQLLGNYGNAYVNTFVSSYRKDFWGGIVNVLKITGTAIFSIFLIYKYFVDREDL